MTTATITTATTNNNQFNIPIIFKLAGCKIKSKLDAQIQLHTYNIAYGDAIRFRIKFEFEPDDIPTELLIDQLPVKTCFKLATPPTLLPLKLDTSSNQYTLEVVLEPVGESPELIVVPGDYLLLPKIIHKDYGNELVSLTPIKIKVLEPELKIEPVKIEKLELERRELKLAVHVRWNLYRDIIKLRGNLRGKLIILASPTTRGIELKLAPKKLTLAGAGRCRFSWSVKLPPDIITQAEQLTAEFVFSSKQYRLETRVSYQIAELLLLSQKLPTATTTTIVTELEKRKEVTAIPSTQYLMPMGRKELEPVKVIARCLHKREYYLPDDIIEIPIAVSIRSDSKLDIDPDTIKLNLNIRVINSQSRGATAVEHEVTYTTTLKELMVAVNDHEVEGKVFDLRWQQQPPQQQQKPILPGLYPIELNLSTDDGVYLFRQLIVDTIEIEREIKLIPKLVVDFAINKEPDIRLRDYLYKTEQIVASETISSGGDDDSGKKRLKRLKLNSGAYLYLYDNKLVYGLEWYDNTNRTELDKLEADFGAVLFQALVAKFEELISTTAIDKLTKLHTALDIIVNKELEKFKLYEQLFLKSETTENLVALVFKLAKELKLKLTELIPLLELCKLIDKLEAGATTTITKRSIVKLPRVKSSNRHHTYRMIIERNLLPLLLVVDDDRITAVAEEEGVDYPKTLTDLDSKLNVIRDGKLKEATDALVKWFEYNNRSRNALANSQTKKKSKELSKPEIIRLVLLKVILKRLFNLTSSSTTSLNPINQFISYCLYIFSYLFISTSSSIFTTIDNTTTTPTTIIRKLATELQQVFNLWLNVIETYRLDMKERRAGLANFRRKIKVEPLSTIRTIRGNYAETLLTIRNHGKVTSKFKLKIVLPPPPESSDWKLLEPATCIQKDSGVYESIPYTIEPESSLQIPIGIRFTINPSLDTYKYIVIITPV